MKLKCRRLVAVVLPGVVASVMFASAALAGVIGTGTTNISYSGQIATETVGQTGLYDIAAYGADGGSTQGGGLGGLGAAIGGQVELSAGTILDILVGGAGGIGINGLGGGGGGSFVVLAGQTALTPLVIAGGGGGGGAGTGLNGQNGGGAAASGVAGAGGAGGYNHGGGGGGFGTGSTNPFGNGGAGGNYGQNGGSGTVSGTGTGGAGAVFAASNGSPGGHGGNGGYGGGGGGGWGAGGGGGYIGGAGGSGDLGHGGVSFLAADVTTLSLSSVFNEFTGGDGLVTFMLVPTQPPSDVPEPASLTLLGAGVVALGLVRRRRTQT